MRTYPTEPRIVSTGGTNALVGLAYRYDSDNIAEAYGDPEPDDPRNITPVYWSRVSGPANFHIDANSGHIDWIPDAPGTYTVVSHGIATSTSPTPPPEIYSFIPFCLGLANGGAGAPPASQNDGFATVDSQTGGIGTNASTLLTNVPHFWQPADTNVAALVVGLLKEPIAGSPRFAFFPATVWGTNQPPIPAAQTNSGNWLVLSGLTNGQAVLAGQAVILTAVATDARPIPSVQFLSPVGTFVDTAAPWAFSFAIPTNAAGAWPVMAAARDTNGQLATVLLVLNVTNAATIQSIQVDPPVVSLTSLAPFALHVWGLYSDGILRDITDGSTGTKYRSSDRFQISVNTNGVLTAKGNTIANIIISITNGVVFTNVQATANLFNLPPTALITVTSTNGVTGPAPLDVQFTALGSGDPEQASLVYSWDYGDGTPGTNQLLAAHRFWKPGTNVVTLTITDAQGLAGTARFVVSVDDHLLINGSAQTLGSFNIYGRVTITNNGSLIAGNGLHGGIGTFVSGTLTVAGPITMGWLSLTSTSLVTCLPGTASQMYRVDLVVSNDLVVDGSSWIDVSGQGYVAGRTTGNSGVGVPTYVSGGSYGG